MKLILIDGHALIFKMYYAFLGRPMVNGKGVDTSILFGFTKYLIELIDKEKPSHIAVSFDPPGGSFRNQMYPQYKANRGETPQLVIDALEPLTRIVESMGIPVLMVKGFEADDVIGSMAKRSAREGFDVYMVTPDKDYGQLVEEHIFQIKPGKAGGENELLGVAEVCGKWGIRNPDQVIDILALCGDSVDNVPGVQGVGPVGAAKLLSRYGSVEEIYSHLEELTSRQKEMFEAARGHIGLSKQLVTIKTDIPLETSASEMVFDTVLTPELNALFDLYEFPSLKRKLASMVPAVRVIAEETAPKKIQVLEYKTVTPSEIRAEKIALDISGTAIYVATDNAVASGTAEDFRDILEDESVVKAGVCLKEHINTLAASGIALKGHLEDIEIMHYLLNPERSHKLDILARAYLGVELEARENAETGSLFDAVPSEDGGNHERDVFAARLVADKLSDELAKNGMQKLYRDIEEPLIPVLARMESSGVRVDVSSLRDFADSLRRQAVEKEAFVRELAGEPSLNVSSPKQVGEVLFEKLRLDPKAKKSKTGSWPTDETTLQELADRSPIIDAILDYRGTRKLLSTYIEPFPSYISERDGRVHTTFNQALTATGRLSSSNPNLQNIPIRTEQGREIRKAFVAGSPGWVMMSADYSQIELRVMAHFCGDENLVNAFNEGVDVHSATAAKIFGIPVGEVSAEQRRIAKTTNFGIMYGISAFGLSQRLRCSRTEAKRLIDDYFASFPSIRNFIDRTLDNARSKGYVETMFGRRRYVPDVNSQNGNVRQFAERNAVNAPIQGTAADIIKLAMIAVDRALAENGLNSRVVLQIHDELLLEVPADEIEAVSRLLVDCMEGVIELSVPLKVECSYGENWLEAH
ncbi:MAG: DNA polymerase I [Bacteroidales bacterium]|nr:DNA polymerase I [Bacteroidales bacterium]